MTDELGSSARALLDAAREGLSPDAAAIERVRTRVDLAVAGTGAAAGATGLTLAGKLGILAVVAAIATGGYLVATRDEAPAPRPAVVTTRPVDPPAPEPPAIEPSAPAAAPPLAPPAKPVKPRAKSPVPEVVLAPVRIQRTKIDLAREVELVDRAMASLRRGDARDALAAVHAHASETRGAGQLAEDAAAIEIEALCKLSDATVPHKLAAFEVRWPHSAQRSRLTTRCP